MKRILASGLVAGVVFFIWVSVIHLATPLARVGVRALPNDEPIMTAVKSTVPEAGLYMFPGAYPGEKASKAERRAVMAAAMEKMKSSPTGMMVVFPQGRTPVVPALMLTELANDILQGLLLAWLLSKTSMTTMGDKVNFALVVGVAAALATNISYWNWYGFPTDYTLVYMFGEVGGYVVMGVAIAVMTAGKIEPKLEVAR
jgi:hypothetical protein